MARQSDRGAHIQDSRHAGSQAGGIEVIALIQCAGHFVLPAPRPRRVVPGTENNLIGTLQRPTQCGMVEQVGGAALGIQIIEAADTRGGAMNQQ
ncbi:hypothetical protein D9M68_905410 [compost metagenome]